MGGCEHGLAGFTDHTDLTFVEGFPVVWEGLQLIGILTVAGNGARVPVYARCREEAQAAVTQGLAQIALAIRDEGGSNGARG